MQSATQLFIITKKKTILSYEKIGNDQDKYRKHISESK